MRRVLACLLTFMLGKKKNPFDLSTVVVKVACTAFENVKTWALVCVFRVLTNTSFISQNVDKKIFW